MRLEEEFQQKSFKSEEEEAKWWDQRQDGLAEEFERAAAEGMLGHGTAARVDADKIQPRHQSDRSKL